MLSRVLPLPPGPVKVSSRLRRTRSSRSAKPFPGYVRYETSNGTAFNIYQTQFAGTAGHTIAQIHVQDVEKEVDDMKARGVVFEVYDDMPGVEWRGDVAFMPEMGKAAWFKDSEGNILCVDEPAGGL